MVPRYVDDGQSHGGPAEWPTALEGSASAFPGVDYAALGAAVRSQFEDAQTIASARTRAIVVIHRVSLRARGGAAGWEGAGALGLNPESTRKPAVPVYAVECMLVDLGRVRKDMQLCRYSCVYQGLPCESKQQVMCHLNQMHARLCTGLMTQSMCQKTLAERSAPFLAEGQAGGGALLIHGAPDGAHASVQMNWLSLGTQGPRACQGKLVLERYSATERLTASMRLLSWSLAKSLTSAMLGMRVRDGELSLSQLASAPNWSAAEAQRRNITGAGCLDPKP